MVTNPLKKRGYLGAILLPPMFDPLMALQKGGDDMEILQTINDILPPKTRLR